MKLKIAICDDEQKQIEYLKSAVEAWAEQKQHSVAVSTFLSAEAFLFEYDEDKSFDILLLDVEMEKISGIELAKKIRKDNLRAEIIFITSHFEFYGEGYEVDALHYLIKPVSAEKLETVLDKAVGKLQTEAPSVIIISDGETMKIPETDILYVEAFKHYITIHTKTKEYMVKESISAFEERLSEGFFKIHRSYIVSLRYITKISRTSVTVGGVELPLARGKYDEVNMAFIKYN